MSTSKRITTLVLFGITALALSCIGFLTTPIAHASQFPENDNLSDIAIKDRFHQINTGYEVGEEFSASDADFVNRYAQKPDSPMPLATQNFSVSGRSPDGTTVSAYGNLYHNGTISYSYGGNVTVNKTAGSTPRSMTLTVHCTSYGIVGSGGVGIIYNDGVSHTANWVNSFYASPSRTYAGVMTAYSVEGWIDVTTASGNFFTIH